MLWITNLLLAEGNTLFFEGNLIPQENCADQMWDLAEIFRLAVIIIKINGSSLGKNFLF